MREYIKIMEVSPKEVFQYLENGWEIIDRTKVYVPNEVSRLTFQVGYPAAKKVEDLRKIIDEYEKHGLKEKLFEMMANENSKPAQYVSWYERTVRDEEENYTTMH